ncbi:conserved protein of unknown function precursor containing a T9SS type A C-terminal secretion signal [Tenacibaculum sp. 190524A02b]|uniref:GEVED domain-containing protein n=1 Tax=Tenacibaculum vairaonense TaxID=3137860 RepID=UPI0032B2EFDC
MKPNSFILWSLLTIIVFSFQAKAQNGPSNYCSANGGTTTDEHIGSVQLGTINNSSTTNATGYSDFTNLSTVLTKNTTYTISIKAVLTTPIEYWEAFKVWIDYNQDGDFDDQGELIWTQNATPQRLVSGNFTVPKNVRNGATRMRVRMSADFIRSSCGTAASGFGEVEDYTVIIQNSSSKTTPNHNMKVFPNPVTEKLLLKDKNSETKSFEIANKNGIIVSKGTFTSEINVNELPKGNYFLKVNSSQTQFKQTFIKN